MEGRKMTLDAYQKSALMFANYPRKRNYEYLCLGLCGEAGEVAEKLKKIMRSDNCKLEENPNGSIWLTPEQRDKIMHEVGDVLWYVATLSSELNFSLQEVAEANIKKLTNRLVNGTIKGDGDDR